MSLDNFLFNDKKKYKIYSFNSGVNHKNFGGCILQIRSNTKKIYKWGENQNYENSIEIICDNQTFFIDKFFSKSENEYIELKIFNRDGPDKILKFKDNQFENMFLEVTKNFKKNVFKKHEMSNIQKNFINNLLFAK